MGEVAVHERHVPRAEELIVEKEDPSSARSLPTGQGGRCTQVPEDRDVRRVAVESVRVSLPEGRNDGPCTCVDGDPVDAISNRARSKLPRFL